MRSGTWTVHATINGRADAASTFTNMPLAETFLFSSHRHVVAIDLTGMTYVRFKVNKQATAGQAGSKLILRFNESFSTTLGDYRDIGVGGSEVSVGVDVVNTFLDTGWIELNEEAKHDVFLAVIGSGGNSTLDPQFGNISVSAC